MPGTHAANRKAVAAGPAAAESRTLAARADPTAAEFAVTAPLGIQRLADASAAQANETAAPFGTVVDDGRAVGAGQIARAEFIARIASAIEELAHAELARAGYNADDCPYLAYWLRYYQDKPAARI